MPNSLQNQQTLQLIADIDAFMSRTGVKKTRIGKDSCNDPALVDDLKSGRRNIGLKRLEAVRAYLARWDDSETPDRAPRAGFDQQSPQQLFDRLRVVHREITILESERDDLLRRLQEAGLHEATIRTLLGDRMVDFAASSD